MTVPDDAVTPLLTPADLAPFATIDDAKATQMIADAVAMAALVAPCILEDTFTQQAAAKAILRAAVLRWNDSGSGAASTQTAGPFGVTLDTRQQRRGMFWPSEIEDLQNLCRGVSTGAFSIGPAGSTPSVVHASTCPALSGGACVCGAVTGSLFSCYGSGPFGLGIPTSEPGFC